MEYHVPDEQGMQRLLRANSCSATGVLLRLAWLQGLSRLEIYQLTWDMIDFDADLLRLPDREVPLHEDTKRCLSQWRILCRGDYVAYSEQRKNHLTEQSISRLVRFALDSEHMEQVRLVDLRHDYIHRLLQEHDWPYVLRVAGYSVTTYRYKVEKNKRNTPKDAEDDTWLRLREVFDHNKNTPGGIALWLSWYLNLTAGEIVSLTWDDVDLDKGCAQVGNKTYALPPPICELLRAEKLRRQSEEDPHVILSQKARKPMRAERLSVVIRTILIQGGIEHQTLVQLKKEYGVQMELEQILNYILEHGSVSNQETARILGVSYAAARTRLEMLERQGKIAAVNARYYPAETVVPPEQYGDALIRYLETHGATATPILADYLHIGKRHCESILRELVQKGELTYDRKNKRFLKRSI